MDRRSSSPEVLRELRARAVALKQQGLTHADIARVLDIGESTSRLYWSRFKAGGEGALELGRRGRRAGTRRQLSPRQEQAIQKAITDHTPDQLKMPFALWTREAVRELVERRYGVRLPVRTLGEYLKRWGFTPQKPKRKDYEQQPVEVQRWLDEIYPGLEAKARRENADIYWGDETGVNNQDQVGRGYAPRGCTPVRQARAKKVSCSMVSALTNKGQVRFMVYRGGMNTTLFLRFLRRLVASTPRKVILIVDNLRVHKARKVVAWLEGRQDQIELFYLPSYSPELNPDEYLNNALKKRLGNRTPAAHTAEQQQRVRQQMRSIQKSPGFIRSLFSAPSVRYAA